MYGVLKDNNLIALHKDMEVIEEFIDNEEGVFDIILISRKKSKHIKNSYEYEDLDLVKSGNQYLPRKYAFVKENESNSFTYDLQITKSFLKKLLNVESINHKEEKSIKKTLRTIDKRKKDIKKSFIDMNTLENIHELDKLFKERIRSDE